MTCQAVLAHAPGLVAFPAALDAAEVQVRGDVALPDGNVAMVAVSLHGQEVRLVLEARADEYRARGGRPRHHRAGEEVALHARHRQHLYRLLLALELGGRKGSLRRGSPRQRDEARLHVVDGALDGVAFR